MTIEEYEKIIQNSTDETIKAQAMKNAAESSAIATGVSGFASSQGQALTGGTGEKPDQITEQERAANQTAAENAALQNSQSVKVAAAPAAPAAEPAKAPTKQDIIREDEKKRAIGRMEASSLKAAGQGEVPDLPTEDDKYVRKMEGINAERYQNLMDYVSDIKKRQQQDEEEMRRQEQADMWSTMGTGATELAAGIVNMLGVGQLDATHQQYKSFSSDWMKKADENIREHRRRRDNMRDTLDRLNMQMNDLKSAQSLQELQLKMQLAEKKKAEEKQERDWQFKQQQYRDALAQQEKDNAFKEKQIGIQEQARKDSAAQGWARINQAKENTKTQMLANGWVPDKNAPGGFRYDPEKASEYGVKVGGKNNEGIEIPLVANGSLPAETLRAKDWETAANNIFINIGAVTDLTPDQKDAVAGILANEDMKPKEKAEELKRYLVFSGQLRSLFKGEKVNDDWLYYAYEPTPTSKTGGNNASGGVYGGPMSPKGGSR